MIQRLLILLVLVGLALSQQHKWQNPYTSWNRTVLRGPAIRNITILDYVFKFAQFVPPTVRPSQQSQTDNTNQTPNLRGGNVGLETDNNTEPTFFSTPDSSFLQSELLDGEFIMENLEDTLNSTQWWLPSLADGELDLGDGEFTSSGLGNGIIVDQQTELFLPYFVAVQKVYPARLLIDQTNSTAARLLYVNVKLLTVDAPKDYIDPLLVNEAYEIFINLQGNVTLKCAGYVSFIRAMETFMQLISEDAIINRLPMHIADYPSFPWRGIMIDLARHFIPIDEIKTTIRAMRISNLNVLHLHITDSESFPLQLQQFPDVTKYGAYSVNETYTKRNLTDIITFAQQRGVVVVPEVDQPGHTASWARSPEFEELNACGGAPAANWTQYCYQPPCGQLDPTLNKTYLLVNSVLAEVQSIFPATYVHMGADEFVPSCWKYNTSILTFMEDNNFSGFANLFDYFFKQANQYVGPNRRRIYWNANDLHNLSYIQGGILQYWQGSEESDYASLQDVDNQVILTPYDALYFDCGMGNLLGDNSWCDPYKPWWEIYNFNTTRANLGDRLLGAEAALWGEMINYNSLDVKAWPRGTALGMRLWNNDQPLTRLQLAKELIKRNKILEVVGARPSPVSVEYCERHPELCFFD